MSPFIIARKIIQYARPVHITVLKRSLTKTTFNGSNFESNFTCVKSSWSMVNISVIMTHKGVINTAGSQVRVRQVGARRPDRHQADTCTFTQLSLGSQKKHLLLKIKMDF